MTGRRATGRILGLACTAIAVAATAPISLAAPVDLGSSRGIGYLAQEDSNPVIAGGDLGFSVPCPDNGAAIGGGLFITGAASEAFVGRSINYTFQDTYGWVVGGQNLAGPAKDFTGYAICRKAGTQGLRYVFDDGPLDPGRLTLTAKCPKGTEVVGGGAYANRVNSFVRTSRPFDGGDRGRRPDDGWRAELHNGSAGTGTGNVAAVCQRNDRWEISYARDVDESVAADDVGNPTASCPRSASVAGGGAAVGPGDGDAWLNALRPVDGADKNSVPDDGWEVYVYNATSDAKDITAFAVCKS